MIIEFFKSKYIILIMEENKENIVKTYFKQISDTAICFEINVNNHNHEACFFPHHDINSYKHNKELITNAQNHCIKPTKLKSIIYDVKLDENEVYEDNVDKFFKSLDKIKICFSKDDINNFPKW